MSSEQKNLSQSSIRIEKVLLSNSTDAPTGIGADVKSTKESIVLHRKETKISEKNESESIVLDKKEIKISEKRDTESIELNNEKTQILEKKDKEIITDQKSLPEILSQTKKETETDDIFQGKHFRKDDLTSQKRENTTKSSSQLNKTEIKTMKKLTKKLSNVSLEEKESDNLLSKKSTTSKLLDKHCLGKSKSDLDMLEFYKTQSIEETHSGKSSSTSVNSNDYYTIMNEVFGDLHDFVKIEIPKFTKGVQIKSELKELNKRIGNIMKLACEVKNDLLDLMPTEEADTETTTDDDEVNTEQSTDDYE